MSLIQNLFGDSDWLSSQTGSAQNFNLGTGFEGWRPTGNDVVEFKIIEPPDDRYIPGYSRTEADGDKKIVMPRLKDLNVPFSLYGLPIPITFGVRRLYGNIIWAIPLKENIKKQTDGGSGGPRKITWEYEYFATYAVAFGYASDQVAGARDIIRIWLDGTLAYDRRAAGEVKIQGLNFVYYEGSEDQVADPTIEAREGVGNVPGYRGLQYIVIKDLPVMDFGNRPPSVSIEVGDATSEVYSITNIDATAGGLYPLVGSQTASLVDWTYMYAFTFTNGVNAQVRTYDLTTNEVVLSATPNPDGIGWNVNGTDSYPDLMPDPKTGIRATITGLTYLTGSQKVFGSCSTIGRAAVMLLDPFTGLVLKWCGCNNLGTTMAYPEVDDNFWPKTGNIPIYRQAAGQLVYSLTSTEQYIVLDNFYSLGGLMFIKEEEEGLNPIKFFPSIKVKQIVPGPRRIGYSFVMVILDGYDSVQFYRIDSGAGRSRILPATPTAKPGIHVTWGVNLALTMDLPATPQNVVYFEFDNSVIIFMDDGRVRKYTLNLADEFDLTWDVDIGTANLPDDYLQNMDLNNVEYGFIGFQTGDGVVEFDLTFGTLKTYSAIDGHFFANGKLFNSQTKTIAGIGYSGSGGFGEDQTSSKNLAFSIGYYDILNDAQVPLAEILRGLSVYAGYDLAEIEVDSEIDDIVDGAIITEVTTFRSVIDPITALYRIDCIESDGKVKFKRKPLEYDSSDYTVADGVLLLDSPNEPDAPVFNLRREEEIAVPERVQVRYIDKALSYNWSMVMATRSREIVTNDSETQMTYQVPIIMSAEQAKLLANRVLWYTWSSRVSYSFRLPYSYLKVEPGDVGIVQAGGLEYKVKSVQVSYNNDFSVSIVGSSFQSDEAVTVIAGQPSGYPQTIPTNLPPVMFIFDVPLLRPQDDANFASQFPVYYYVGPAKVNVTFTGAIAEMGFNSSTLADVGVNKVESVVCRVINVPAVDEGLLRIVNDNIHLDVVPVSGDPLLLESCTFEELLAGANVAAWGRGNKWEIIQFQNVEQVSARRYRLTGILRGVRGSDLFVNSHKTGDNLVLFGRGASIGFHKLTFADLDRTLFYRGTSVAGGKSTVPYSQKLNGHAVYSWVPGAVEAHRELGGDQSLEITWRRRSRTYGDMVDGGQNIPLGSTEKNKWKVLVHRRPYYAYTYNTVSDEWDRSEGPDTGFEFLSNTPSITITAAAQRSMKLFEYDVPDDMDDPFTSFTSVNGSNHPDNLADYQHMRDLGFDQWHAFKWVEVTIYQGYEINGEEGYGYGRKQRVYIKDL